MKLEKSASGTQDAKHRNKNYFLIILNYVKSVIRFRKFKKTKTIEEEKEKINRDFLLSESRRRASEVEKDVLQMIHCTNQFAQQLINLRKLNTSHKA